MDQQNKQLRSLQSLKNLNNHHARYYKTDSPNPTYDSGEYWVEDPVECAHCNRIGDQVFVELMVITGDHSKYDALGLYGCKFCKESTISYFNFEWVSSKYEGEVKTYRILSVAKHEPKVLYDVDIDHNIQSKYKDFTEIFFQAKQAEEVGLDHLAGMGYRKAIEFLVTDFLKDYPPDETVTHSWLEDPHTRLSQKILKLPTKRLTKTAKAITHLGNDETHYTIRHPDYNLQDMKRFISLLLKEIESEHIYADVEEFVGE